MLTDGIDRINRELDSLTNPARQALNSIIRSSLERSSKGHFSVLRTRKFKGTEGVGSVLINFKLDETSTLKLVSLDSATLDKFASIAVGDSVIGNGIPENAVVTGKQENAIIISAAATETTSSVNLTISAPIDETKVDANLRGAEEVELRLERWMLVSLHEFFKKWAEGDYSGTSFDDLIVEDNTVDSDVNTILPYGKIPVIGDVTENGIQVIKTPATRALVMLSKIIYGDFDNLTDYDSGNANAVYSLNLGEDGSPVSKDTFNGSDDVTIFGSNFADGDVAYWLFKIRNPQNNRVSGNASPVPINVRTPLYNKNLGVVNYDGNQPYILPFEFHKNDHLGYYGDSVQREAGGYSWDIATEHLSIGIGNQAEGKYSFASGNDTIAGDSYNATFNCGTWGTDIVATAFGKNTIAGEMPYTFTNGIYDDTLDIEISCVDCEEVLTLEGLSLDVDNLDITLAIDATGLDYAIGEKLLLFNALDGNRNKRSESVTATILTEPVVVEKNDGSGYKTLVQLSFDSDVVGTFRSGWASRRWDGSSDNYTRFVIGQNNKPTRHAIFQLGAQSDNETGARDTRMEVGFDNGNYAERYFRFGPDDNSTSIFSKIDYMRVSPDEFVLSIGASSRSYIRLDTDEAKIDEGRGNSGRIIFDNVEGNLLLESDSASSTFVEIDDSNDVNIYVNSGSTSLLMSDGIQLTSELNMSVRTLSAYITFQAEDNLTIDTTSTLSFNASTVDIYADTLNIEASSISASVNQAWYVVENQFNLNLIESTSQHNIDGSILDIESELAVSNNFPNIFSTASNTGFSHTHVVDTSANDISIVGAPSIATPGFHHVESGSVYRLDDPAYVTGSTNNMVPDTPNTFMRNLYMVNIHNDDWKWIIGKSRQPAGRIWTTTQANGQWEPWRSFTYHDEVSQYGNMYSYSYELLKFVDAQGDRNCRIAGIIDSDYVDEPIGGNIVINATDKTGTTFADAYLGQLNDYSKMSIQNFEFKKIGYTVFFRIKIYIASGYTDMVAGGSDLALMMILNDEHSELTPASRNSDNVSKSYRFLATDCLYTRAGSVENSYKLTIRKFRNTGTSFVITLNNNAQDINTAGQYLEFTGHYFSENNEKLIY